MDPVSRLSKLAGWPEDPKRLDTQQLLDLWTFSIQPLDVDRLRADAFREMTDRLSSPAELLKVVGELRRGSAAEKALVTMTVAGKKTFASEPDDFSRFMTALYATAEDKPRSQSNLDHLVGGAGGPSTSSAGASDGLIGKPAVSRGKDTSPVPDSAPVVADSSTPDADGEPGMGTSQAEMQQKEEEEATAAESGNKPVPVQDTLVGCKTSDEEGEKDPCSGAKRNKTPLTSDIFQGTSPSELSSSDDEESLFAKRKKIRKLNTFCGGKKRRRVFMLSESGASSSESESMKDPEWRPSEQSRTIKRKAQKNHNRRKKVGARREVKQTQIADQVPARARRNCCGKVHQITETQKHEGTPQPCTAVPPCTFVNVQVHY